MHHTNEHLETISIECAKKKKYEHCTKIAICSLSCLSDDTPTYWFNLLPVLCCAVKSLCPKEENLRTHTCRRGRQDGWGRGRVTHSSVKHCPKWGQSALAFCVTELSFRSHHICLYHIYAYIWTKDSRMCRCRGIVLYIFTIFIFVLTHTQTQARVNSSSSICLFVYLPVSCGWWINFCLYSSHETQTEKRTEIKRSRITFAWNQRQSNAQDTRDTGPEKPKTGHRHRDPVKASHPQQVSSLSVILPANTSDEQCQCASFDCKVTRFTGDVLIACPG